MSALARLNRAPDPRAYAESVAGAAVEEARYRPAPVDPDADEKRTAAPELPPHVDNFLTFLTTHFARARDARPWDAQDERDYGRLIIGLTGAQCREVFALLRTRHQFMPSVVEVRKAVEDTTGVDREKMPAHAAAAMRIVSRRADQAADLSRPALAHPPGCEPLGSEWGRELARRKMAELRGATLNGGIGVRPPATADQEGGGEPEMISDAETVAAREAKLRALREQAAAMTTDPGSAAFVGARGEGGRRG